MRELVSKARREIAEHWASYLVLGAVLLACGVAAVVFPFMFTLSANLALGAILLVSGAATVIHAFFVGEWRGFILSFMVGLLYAVISAYLALVPVGGMLTLSLLLAVLFVVGGVIEIGFAVLIRPQRGWLWLLASGIVALAVGALILAKLPASALWALGLLVGVRMIFAGCSFILLSLTSDRIKIAA